jgi:hypothetical protein
MASPTAFGGPASLPGGTEPNHFTSAADTHNPLVPLSAYSQPASSELIIGDKGSVTSPNIDDSDTSSSPVQVTLREDTEISSTDPTHRMINERNSCAAASNEISRSSVPQMN